MGFEYFRYDIINFLIDKFKYNSYLEIGTKTGKCTMLIKAKIKETVDPVLVPNAKYYTEITYNMTSDEAFKIIKEKNKKYDIIFIDGLHTGEQVDKDIINSLEVLNPGGAIVLHDCNPLKVTDLDPQLRNGTCYKSIVKLRCTRDDLFVCTVDTDHGCGVVIPNRNQQLYKETSLERAVNFEYFSKHKKELINLLSYNRFKEIFNKNEY